MSNDDKNYSSQTVKWLEDHQRTENWYEIAATEEYPFEISGPPRNSSHVSACILDGDQAAF